MNTKLQGYRKWRHDYPKTMFFAFLIVTTMAFPFGIIWMIADAHIKE